MTYATRGADTLGAMPVARRDDEPVVDTSVPDTTDEPEVAADPAGHTEATDTSEPTDPDKLLAENRQNRERIREAADRTPRKLDGEAGGGRRRLRLGLRTVAGALGVLVIALAVATGVLAYLLVRADNRVGSAGPSDGERAVVMQKARDYAAEIGTYDPANYRDLDRRIRQISTPTFFKSFVTDSQDGRKGNANVGGVSKAVSNEAGVESVSGDKAVVLVTLDQTVTSPKINERVPQGIPYQSRVRITLSHVGDRWLLNDLATI